MPTFKNLWKRLKSKPSCEWTGLILYLIACQYFPVKIKIYISVTSSGFQITAELCCLCVRPKHVKIIKKIISKHLNVEVFFLDLLLGRNMQKKKLQKNYWLIMLCQSTVRNTQNKPFLVLFQTVFKFHVFIKVLLSVKSCKFTDKSVFTFTYDYGKIYAQPDCLKCQMCFHAKQTMKTC